MTHSKNLHMCVTVICTHMYTRHYAKGLMEKQFVENKLSIALRRVSAIGLERIGSKLKETKEDDACTGRGKASEGSLIDLPLIPIPDQCRCV